MSKRKLYFCESVDDCSWTKDQFIDWMKENHVGELTLTEVKREIKSDYFYCRANDSCGERGDGECGRLCIDYEPRNGKSGICKHWAHTVEPTGQLINVVVKENEFTN